MKSNGIVATCAAALIVVTACTERTSSPPGSTAERAATITPGTPPAPVRATPREPDRQPLFFEYTTARNDTVSALARRFGISPNYIRWNNPAIRAGEEDLQAGLAVRIPPTDGILHTVQPGDTIDAIAARYGADPAEIVRFRTNGLEGRNADLRAGSIILVPHGTRDEP